MKTSNFFKASVLLMLAMLFFPGCGGKKDDGGESPSNNQNPPDNQSNKGSWVQKANYQGAAVAYAVGFSVNGKIYVGMGSNGNHKNDLWQYDPATNKWTERKDFPGTGNLAYFVANNKAYVIASNMNMWEYNPETDSWMQKASYPDNNLYAAATHIYFNINNKGYVGYYYGSFSSIISGFYEYNPATDTWKKCMNTPWGITVATATDQIGYAMGNDICYTYNPTTDKWAQKANFPLSGSDYSGGIAFCEDGVIYAGLGAVADYHSYIYSNQIYKYDSDANSWSVAITVPDVLTREGAVAVMCNGKLYVGLGLMGVDSGVQQCMLDFWEYSF